MHPQAVMLWCILEPRHVFCWCSLIQLDKSAMSHTESKRTRGKQAIKSGTHIFQKTLDFGILRQWPKICPVKRLNEPLNHLMKALANLLSRPRLRMWLHSPHGCFLAWLDYGHTPQAQLPPPINEEMRCQHTGVYSTLIYFSTGSRGQLDHRRHQMI